MSGPSQPTSRPLLLTITIVFLSLAILVSIVLVGRGLWQTLAGDAVQASDQNAQQPPKQQPAPSETVETLRKRLAHEAKHADARPKLSKETEQRLQHLEFMLVRERRNVIRAMLKDMHDENVKRFVDAEGFGMERMIIFTPDYLHKPESPPIVVQTPKDGFTDAYVGAKVTLPKDDYQLAKNPMRLPSPARLLDLHDLGTRSFVNLAGFTFVPGYNNDPLGNVAAEKRPPSPVQMDFKEHMFRHMPDLTHHLQKQQGKDQVEKWQIKRLDLVSLLKHETPVAYVTHNLPRMDELRKAPTRALSPWEEKAVEALRGGEQLVTESNLNQLQMMGALRAANQCLSCHRVQRWALLGAFSYDLRRTPPIKLPPAS